MRPDLGVGKVFDKRSRIRTEARIDMGSQKRTRIGEQFLLQNLRGEPKIKA